MIDTTSVDLDFIWHNDSLNEPPELGWHICTICYLQILKKGSFIYHRFLICMIYVWRSSQTGTRQPNMSALRGLLSRPRLMAHFWGFRGLGISPFHLFLTWAWDGWVTIKMNDPGAGWKKPVHDGSPYIILFNPSLYQTNKVGFWITYGHEYWKLVVKHFQRSVDVV